MDNATLTALKQSIAHWERMRGDPHSGEKPIAAECPLCRIYNDTIAPDPEDWDACDGCPVKTATGLEYCRGTPYDNAAHAHIAARYMKSDEPNYRETIEEWKAAAQDEIDFLRSLLPKEAP